MKIMAEFPDLGAHCGYSLCRQLDFLPMRCDACEKIFCKDHITYASHECPSSYKKDVQVPVCPLCNKPVPVNRVAGELTDVKVGQHMDRDCKSESKKPIYKNKCNLKGCKQKELIPILCSSCRLNFCLKHRHTTDHDCKGYQNTGRAVSNTAAAAMARQEKKPNVVKSSSAQGQKSVQGNMTEDEALAMAMQMSLNEQQNSKPLSQEEQDRILAESLQKGEYEEQPRQQTTRGRTTGSKDRCVVG